MDVRWAPSEHYDFAAELIEQGRTVDGGDGPTPTELYLQAIAETLQGLLKAEMDR